MNTRFVEAFLWLARLGSFRAASDRLHITQAAVANRVASLEEDIGARLFAPRVPAEDGAFRNRRNLPFSAHEHAYRIFPPAQRPAVRRF